MAQLPRLLATSDIHSPEYLQRFVVAVNKARESKDRPCLVLLAGDIVDRGNVQAARPVVEVLSSLGAKIVATFGNDEYQETWDAFRSQYPGVDWLVDELKVYSCGPTSVSVVGTPGALDEPTRWQRQHVPGIDEVYRRRVDTVAELLRQAKKEGGVTVLLSHYGLARATLKGEDPRTYPMLYSSRMEKVVAELKPSLAVHGHAHRGQPFALVGGVPVYNVAFPVNWSLVELRQARVGLEAFL